MLYSSSTRLVKTLRKYPVLLFLAICCSIIILVCLALRLINCTLTVAPPSTTATGDITDKPIKRILLWTPIFADPMQAPYGIGRSPFRECDFNNCESTTNRSQLLDSDAVVFHWRSWPEDLPSDRHAKQVWVMLNREPEEYHKKNDDALHNMINWTMTYRLDSDVIAPYGFFRRIKHIERNMTSSKLEPDDLPVEEDEIVEELGLVSWMVSSCDPPSKRHLYANELSKYIPIDVYGKCGMLGCPIGNRSLCADHVYNKYKFYLSFENSLCTDYVTEKFFGPLKYGTAVPIVYGAADYRHRAPPHSYIDTNDFESPRHLAEYLKLLNDNDALYREYHAWRAQYTVEIPYYMCHLCSKLNSDSVGKARDRAVPYYYSFKKWWFRIGNCRRPSWNVNDSNHSYNLLEDLGFFPGTWRSRGDWLPNEINHNIIYT